jgi:uncharacterized membrane protein (TIGR01666 family)
MQLPISKSVSKFKQFLLSQYFYDGLKITLGVILPSIICYQIDQLQIGITISLGALFVSITDNPGAISHKRNAMIAANVFIFIMAIIIGFTNKFGILLAFEIPIFCFIFSMLTVYGARASSVGIAALLVMIVGIDQHLNASQTLIHALLLVSGGIWYLLFSMTLTQVLPYRPAEQMLGECIFEIAKYIKIKSDFYDTKNNLETNQRALIDQQILVNQAQENVREILFKTRKLLKDSSPQGNLLIMSFIDVVDLFEHAMESHQKYDVLHKEYDSTKILTNFQKTIFNLSEELKYIGLCIHNHDTPKRIPLTADLLVGIKSQIDALDQKGIQTVSLKKILVNLRNMSQRVEKMYAYHQSKTNVPDARRKEIHTLATHHQLDWKLFRENLTFKSSIFRHSFRVAIVCLIAFIFARIFYTGQFSYWILLTILVILKPAFSQTKKRNYERIVGTVAGGLLGILILFFVKDLNFKFWLLLFFMILTYSFARIKYVVSVFFMTPFILLMFDFIGQNNEIILVKERILDTFIGAGIASLASYFILPSWESFQIKKIMSEMISKNILYLKSVTNYKTDDLSTQLEYRLARKEMYVSTSNLSSAFQRMLNEPKRKQQHVNEANKFILLNNLFASNIASISFIMKEDNPKFSDKEIRELRKSINLMRESYSIYTKSLLELDFNINLSLSEEVNIQQLELCNNLVQIASEIKKLSTKIIDED